MEKGGSDKKHIKYFSSYVPNEIFWGIGIENETYLEIQTQELVSGQMFQNQQRERYSVDYYKTYLNKCFNRSLDTIIDYNKEYALPLLMNGHELTKNDLSGQPIKNYNETSSVNKKFSGKTVFEYMCETDSYFKEEYEKSFCFDGDTIEFMTQNFYKANTRNIIDELLLHKKTFLKRINSLSLPVCKNEKFIYPVKNHGFARFTTNHNNLSIFNNSTYHFNFTLPTQLDDSANIANKKDFDKRHSRAIRVLQLLEPFFIAKYGSGDIFATNCPHNKRYPKGSQRVAASRYIGAGTYNTTTLVPGKLLQANRVDIEPEWYTKLYSQINYAKGDKMGYDINFNKFKNHGIEIRFFDWFPEEYLEKVLQFLVHLLDHSEMLKIVDNPIKHEMYNSIMYKALLEGKDAILNMDELLYIKKSLKIKLRIKNKNIISIYTAIEQHFDKLYGYSGPCSKYMLEQPTVCCKIFSRY